jgi:16S rRNA (cytosine967-C5)-methyltransferase
VNAVLRRVSREREKLPLPPRDSSSRDASLAYLSTTLSHPQWLVARWLDRFGFDAAEAWCRFNNEPAALTVRANTLKTTRQELADQLEHHGVSTRAGRFAPDALVVESGNPLRTPLASTGTFFVQDEASQVVTFMADARRGERVLDACASPGGKTTAMAAAMEDDGLVVAMDVRPRRVRLLADTVARSGAKNIHVVHGDASSPIPFHVRFDCVFVDAPCSGLGTLRRDPDIKWRRQPDDLGPAADYQVRLLDVLSAHVRPGGRLVYATCSSEPDENDDVIRRFLSAHDEFRVRPPDRIPPSVRPLLEPSGSLRTLPFRDGLEAFFAVSLFRPTADAASRPSC